MFPFPPFSGTKFVSSSTFDTPLYPEDRMNTKTLWFVKDAAGIGCASFTVFLILYAEVAVVFMNIFPWFEYRATSTSLFLVVSFTAVVFMALWAHFKALTSDPGSVPLPPADYQMPEAPTGQFEKFGETVTVCKKCKYYKPLVAHHCSTCNRCIRKLDHHCPWVNNCVGERNQKFFFLFLLYIFLSSAYASLIVGTRMYQCSAYGMKACNMDPENPVAQIVCSAFLFFEALIFGLFVVIMAGDQLNGIRKNQTGIDRLKHPQAKVEQATSFCERFAHVFGGGEFRWSWLLPVPPPIRVPEWYP